MSFCSCIKNNYNFSLRSYEQGVLLYEDLSIWMCPDIPLTYDISIKRSDGTYEDPITLNTKGINLLTAENTGVSIQDGIYCFKTTSCGKKYERAKAVTQKLDCQLDHLIAQGVNIPEYLDIAEKAEKYIEAIHYNAERGYLKEAQYYYTLARNILSCITCNC